MSGSGWVRPAAAVGLLYHESENSCGAAARSAGFAWGPGRALAGGTLPAMVNCPAKKRPKELAASTTALYPCGIGARGAKGARGQGRQRGRRFAWAVGRECH